MKEKTRPTIYRVMKYWGKKPHNIWSSYIKKYSKKGDLILDPFVGSGMTYFESVKNHRTPITIDINPISDLCINCFTLRNVDYELIIDELNRIINKIKNIECYKLEYNCICSNCNKETDIYNYKINGKTTISYKCKYCGKTITDIIQSINRSYILDKWVPTKKLSDLKSVSETFIKKIGGNNISNLWSNRNLKLLSEIYDSILLIENQEIKDILVFAFIQCLHLTSKMCIPRSEKSKRPLSTSWGRPAFMISDKIFEQNPILAFQKAVINSTGVIKGMKSSEKYLGSNISNDACHYLGDSLKVLKKIDSNSISLAITDPPYGDIIQYGDLSEVWVSWLEHYRKDYIIDHENEVIINRDKSQELYEERLEKILVEINRVLKQDGTLILTFNSNNNDDWKSLFKAISNSSFYIDEIIYQKNKRASEANVGAKEGIAISDYYFVCKKGKWDNKKIEKIIVERRIEM